MRKKRARGATVVVVPAVRPGSWRLWERPPEGVLEEVRRLERELERRTGFSVSLLLYHALAAGPEEREDTE